MSLQIAQNRHPMKPAREFKNCPIVMAIVLLLAATVAVAAPSRYIYRTSSADGIRKFYFGREIAHVMGYQGAAWLERPTRDQEERPDLLIKALHLTPGMTVADIGAGSGYLSKRIASAVSRGTVLAEDVQPPMVEMLRELSHQSGAGNVTPILGALDDPKLPLNSVDLAVMVDVYHELEFPYEVVSHVIDSLKSGGQLVFVEYRGEDETVPIKALHKMTVAQVRREMVQFPLTFLWVDEQLPIQHMVFFRKQ